MFWIMAITAAVNQIKFAFDRNAQISELSDQISDLKKERDKYLNLLDTKFSINKKEALKSADRQDVYTTRDEEQLNSQTNLELKQLQLQQQQNANAANLQAQENSAQHGAQLAQIAASGTRASTMTQTAEMQKQQADNLLQSTENNARQATDYTQRRIINNFLQGQNNIQKQRDSAMEIREQFAKGGADSFHGSMFGVDGSKYQLYKYQRWYDEDQYNTQIDKLEDYKDQLNSWTGWNGWFAGLAEAGISGAIGGFGLSMQANNAKGYWESPGKKTGEA